MSSPSESYSKTTRSKSGKPKLDTSHVTTDSPGAAISMQLRNFKPDDPKGKAKATKKKTSAKSALSSDVGNAKTKATLGNTSGSNSKEKPTPGSTTKKKKELGEVAANAESGLGGKGKAKATKKKPP